MIARFTRHAALVMVVALAAACGKPSSQGGPGQATSGRAPAAQSGAATAEEVAKAAREGVRCPARVKSKAPVDGTPVADVVGVRPGMSYEEARDVVLCSNELLVAQEDTSRRFNINTYGQVIRQGFAARFAEARVERTAQQIMADMQRDFTARANNAVRQDMQPGQTKWYVSTMGMPGEERVIAAAREEWFEQGSNPTVDSVGQALVKKYGTPTHRQDTGQGSAFTWAYDPLGRAVTETSPLFNRCRGTADPDGGTNFSPDCGIVIAAEVRGTRENPGLAQFLQVGVLDQANGYEAITATEQGLQQQDAARKAKELESAGKNSKAPTL